MARIWAEAGWDMVWLLLLCHLLHIFAHSSQDEAGGRLSLSAGMQVVEEEEEDLEVEERTYTAHSLNNLSLESTCRSWEAQNQLLPQIFNDRQSKLWLRMINFNMSNLNLKLCRNNNSRDIK